MIIEIYKEKEVHLVGPYYANELFLFVQVM